MKTCEKMCNIISNQGDENRNHDGIPLHTHQGSYNFQKWKMTSVSKNAEELEYSNIVDGILK